MMDESDFEEDEDFDNLLPDSFYAFTSEQKRIGDDEEEVPELTEEQWQHMQIQQRAAWRQKRLLAEQITHEYQTFFREKMPCGFTDLSFVARSDDKDACVVNYTGRCPKGIYDPDDWIKHCRPIIRETFVPWRQAQLIMCLRHLLKHPWFDPNLLQLVWQYI
jgi:hypothetical protein